MTARALLLTMALAAPAEARVFTNTDEVRACVPLDNGDTLVGTGGGLVRVDAAGIATTVWTASDGLPGTRIDALVADRDRVWVGTDAGVAQLVSGRIEGAVMTKPVRDIARWRGTTYLATLDGGVIEVGGKAIAMHGGAVIPRSRAQALAVADGALWAGTAAGLYQLRGTRLEHVDGPRDVTALVASGDDLWIGASDGVWLRAKDGSPRSLGGGELRHLAIVDGAVVGAGPEGVVTIDRGRVVALAGAPRGFAQAIGGRDGAACTGGLDGLWTRNAGTWRHAPKAGGPPSSDVSAVVADGARLWVGTFDQGLASYDAEHGWRHVVGIDARINAMVIEPRSTGARLWVGTAEGIQVVDGDGRVVLRLGKNDGLPSRSVLAMARLSDGRIVAGTSVGAAFVNGETIRRVGPRPPAPPAATEPKRLDDRAVGNVWAIAEAGGSLWLGTTTGLYRGPATAWTSKDGSDDSAAMLDRWQRMSVATGHLKDDWVTAIAVKGDVVWVGTYNGGVSRIDGDSATQLGGGWVNPSGLVWDGDRLLAATMDGLVVGDGRGTAWTTMRALPGRDTTGAVRVGHALWVATRRGLAMID